MAIVKLTLSDEYYQKLKNMAQCQKKSVQDYIRDTIFGEDEIFTPEEAVRRSKAKFPAGGSFTLPEAYDDDWTLERGLAGVFGKRFFNYVSDSDCGIEFIGMDDYGRRAQYKIKEMA